jgi:ribosomal protection tetracycline resistance protein
VFFGSARTGAGVDELTAGIAELLPAAQGDTDGPVSGTVFKIERGAAGEKIAYVRMFSGALRTRDRLQLRGGEAKVTAIDVFDRGAADRRTSVAAGQIARLRGLNEVQIGDAIGVSPSPAADSHHFAPPTLETVVVPCRRADRRALRVALAQLAEQDPLIGVRDDGLAHELSVSLYGEVQKEVIQATLADDYGIDVAFRETTTICIERPAGTGAAFEIIGEDPNPFLATVGLRIDPAPVDSGVDFRLEVELGSMPLSFFKAVEETVSETLRQGLYGWEVTDCTVTMTHSGYWAKQSHSHATFDKSMSSTARDFRQLTPLVVMSALQEAGTTVYEPMHCFRLEAPADTLGPLLPVLAQLGGIPQTPAIRGSTCTLEGEIPAARVHELRHQLPALTRGEGFLESDFEHYQPVRGTVPARPRSGHDPLHREEYVLRVLRRVPGGAARV